MPLILIVPYPKETDYDFWFFAILALRECILLLFLSGMGYYGLLFPSEKKKEEQPFWFDWKKFKTLLPFLWPDTRKLQMLVIACLGLLFAGRVVNVLVPVQYKVVIDALSSPDVSDKRPYYAWGAILVFVSLRFLQGGVGVISTIQSFLWIPIGQFNTREISVKMFEHLHNLSLQFHLNRKTGEVLRVMDRGTASIGSLLSYILFNIVPVFVDIGIAVLYFIFLFDWIFGLVVFLTMALYVSILFVSSTYSLDCIHCMDY